MTGAGRTNPLRALEALGQSVWLDDIRRGWLEDGTLARLIAEDGVSGVTSNPAIFGKSISDTHDYDAAIRDLARRGMDSLAMYEALAIEDVGRAADELRATYDASAARDGYVSLEVSPHLAHDTAATVAEAQRLWARVNRPNLMIKVPGTDEGLPAIRQLIARGINVNVTLLFGIERYRQAAIAFMEGLGERLRAGNPVRSVASVASFFLSRIDVLIDQRLDRIEREESRRRAQELRGQAAVASGRCAYQAFLEVTATPRWRQLERAGAQTQRLLWASTGTKDRAYSDVKYVEPLIGANTVNTLPIETLAAFRDHGRPAARLTDEVEAAAGVAAALSALGIELPAVVRQLEEEGVQKFIAPYDKLLALLTRRQG
jgi:transaldolase